VGVDEDEERIEVERSERFRWMQIAPRVSNEELAVHKPDIGLY
jgi:hypothetical protein